MFDVVWRPRYRVVNYFSPSIISLMVMQPRRANYPVQTRKGDITTRQSLQCCSDFSVTVCGSSCSSYQSTCLAVTGCGWITDSVSGGTCYGRPTVNSRQCCDSNCINDDQTTQTAAMKVDFQASPVSGLEFVFK
jgi:hypothetical protein